MRRLLPLLLLAACTAAPTPPVPAPPPEPRPAVYGLTTEEQARALRLEDRREYDPQLVEAWIHHENPLHRARVALMLGRIGGATFMDANGNGQRDPGEKQARVDALAQLVSDPDANVRATAAFALGLIGDRAATDTLVKLANDPDGDVAGEAVEALSKLAPKLPLATYSPLVKDARPGVRAVAIRFLFRFRSDEASAIAASELESPSPQLRQEAAYALARRAYAPARAVLELLLTDPNLLTRSYAARALGAIASPESLGALMNALLDAHPWVRINAVVAIGRIAAKTPKAIERPELASDKLRIIGLSDDPDPGVRASATDTLGWYAAVNDVARKRLLDIVAEGSRWDREVAAGAIARNLGDSALLPADLSDWAKVRGLESAGAVAESMRAKWANDPAPLVRIYTLSTIADDKVDAHLPAIRTAADHPAPIV